MFANIYDSVQSSHFRDHNFKRWLGPEVEKIPESYIVQLLKGICATPDRKKDEGAYDSEQGFEISTIFEESLSRRACISFFRVEPDVPAEDRDYYLSKLYQLLCLIAKECHAFLLTVHRDWVRGHRVAVNTHVLEDFLNSLPEDVMPEKLAEFDWYGFRNELCTLCRTRAVNHSLFDSLGDLRRFFPCEIFQPEPTAPPESHASRREEVRSTIADMSAADVRQWWFRIGGPNLLKSARSAHTHAQKEAAQACGVALETYKKWESGRIPSKSCIPKLVEYIEAAPQHILVQLPSR
jgi:hypothetical protein